MTNFSRPAQFSYETAFSRNLGWVTEAEQHQLRRKRVAIGGLGGAGGIHLVTLARLGIGAFNLADFDTFDVVNFNRQAGATMATVGKSKVEVMAAAALDINPELDLKLFATGIQPDNVRAFFEGVDLYIDGLDYFAFETRQMVYRTLTELKIPAVSVGPLGMGAALINFLPGQMTFEEYFRWEGVSDFEKGLRFMVGLTPMMMQRTYIADVSRVSLGKRAGPSMGSACQLCAGVAATEALKILLKRGPVYAAPHAVHFDAYRNELVRTWRPWGNANPIQRLMLWFIRRTLARGALLKQLPPSASTPVGGNS